MIINLKKYGLLEFLVIISLVFVVGMLIWTAVQINIPTTNTNEIITKNSKRPYFFKFIIIFFYNFTIFDLSNFSSKKSIIF